MQIQVKCIEEKKEEVFHPFVLEFKIEEESDLESLAVFLNQNHDVLNASRSAYNGYKAKYSCVVWRYIDDLLNTKPYMK